MLSVAFDAVSGMDLSFTPFGLIGVTGLTADDACRSRRQFWAATTLAGVALSGRHVERRSGSPARETGINSSQHRSPPVGIDDHLDFPFILRSNPSAIDRELTQPLSGTGIR
jgi:hypothetical protein